MAALAERIARCGGGAQRTAREQAKLKEKQEAEMAAAVAAWESADQEELKVEQEEMVLAHSRLPPEQAAAKEKAAREGAELQVQHSVSRE